MYHSLFQLFVVVVFSLEKKIIILLINNIIIINYYCELFCLRTVCDWVGLNRFNYWKQVLAFPALVHGAIVNGSIARRAAVFPLTTL